MGSDQKNKFGMGVLTPLPRFVFFVVLSLASTFFTNNWLGVAVSGALITIIYLSGRIYNKLGLKGGKKGKSGLYSTSAAVLEKSKSLAFQALLADPVVDNYQSAEKLLDTMMTFQNEHLSYLK